MDSKTYNNVWRNTYYYHWYRIIRNTKIVLRNIKYSYQRIVRGYSDVDVYDLDMFISALLRDSLKTLSERANGYPGMGEFDTYEKWTTYLKETSDCFKDGIEEIPNKYEDAINYLYVEKDNIDSEYKNKMWQCYLNVEKSNEEYKRSRLHDGLMRIDKIFDKLCD